MVAVLRSIGLLKSSEVIGSGANVSKVAARRISSEASVARFPGHRVLYLGVQSISPSMPLSYNVWTRQLHQGKTVQFVGSAAKRAELRDASGVVRENTSGSGSASSDGKLGDGKDGENSDNEKKANGIKALMKKYGYAALGVYLFLSAIDLPLCYLFVASVGDEKINEWKENIKQFFGFGKKNEDQQKTKGSQQEDIQQHDGIAKSTDEISSASDNNDTKDGDKKGKKDYSAFMTTFLIAYGVHKSLVFIRLPITAYLTPVIVRHLQRLGFNIGKTSTRSVYNVTKQNIQAQGLKSALLSKQAIKKNVEIANKTQKKMGGTGNVYSDLDAEKFGTKPSKKKKWWNFFL